MGPEDDPDVQLMLAVRDGDRSAFRSLFEKHSSAVVGFAMQFVGSKARAEELAQDVFLQLFRTRHSYVARARFKTWLYRMTSNACISELRRAEHRSPSRSIDQPAESGVGVHELVDTATVDGEGAALEREQIERLRRVLDGLPGQQRAALLLARVEGMSYEDVADSLGCSVAAVKSLIHRATVTLRDELAEEA